MTQTFTPNDVVKHLYQEESDKQNHQLISGIIATDEEYNRLHQELSAMKELLDQTVLEPSDKTIENILAFSRQYNACKV